MDHYYEWVGKETKSVETEIWQNVLEDYNILMPPLSCIHLPEIPTI
jgi:hypothetical protein